MVIGYPDKDIWEYAHRDNFIVIPVTGFVRKDGGIAAIHPVTKEAYELYPMLPKKLGYLFANGVTAPTHRTKNVNLIALKDREHYASKSIESVVSESLMILNEVSSENRDYIFYLPGFLGGEEFSKLHEEILSSDRIVVALSSDTNQPVV